MCVFVVFAAVKAVAADLRFFQAPAVSGAHLIFVNPAEVRISPFQVADQLCCTYSGSSAVLCAWKCIGKAPHPAPIPHVVCHIEKRGL